MNGEICRPTAVHFTFFSATSLLLRSFSARISRITTFTASFPIITRVTLTLTVAIMRPTSRTLSARLPAPTACRRPLCLHAATATNITTSTRIASRFFSYRGVRASPAQSSEPKAKIPYSAFSFEHLGISNKWNKYIMIFFITMGTIETYLWYKYLPAWFNARSGTATKLEEQRSGSQSHTAN